MKDTSRPNPSERLRHLHEILERAYGPQHWWPGDSPFEVVLGAYLTQNTSWSAAARSLANLRAAGALTPSGLRHLPLDELKTLIRPSGFFTRKAPALKAFLAMLDQEYSGSLEALAAVPTPELRRRLLSLPGVGQETADAILLYALNHPVPVVDEYLRRIAVRHGLANPAPGPKGYEQLTHLVRSAFASANANAHLRLYNEAHALIVAVGKTHCTKVAQCEGCPLKPDLYPQITPTPHQN